MAIGGVFGGGTQFIGPIRTSVFIKRRWTDSWRYMPYLFPLFSAESSSPSISHAQFVWNIGAISQHDQASYQVYTPLQLEDWYIAVNVHSIYGTFVSFVGIVLNVAVDDFGTNATTFVSSGNQLLNAVGLEYLLKAGRIQGSYVEGGTFIERTLVFNQRHDLGPAFSGNRSNARNGDGVYTFSADGAEWTHLDILEYVLWFYHPGMSFVLGGQAWVLDQFVGQYDFRGKEVWQVLDTLIDRRRGLGWTIYFGNGAGTMTIVVYSVLTEPIQFQDFLMPANPWQESLGFIGRHDLKPRLNVSRAHTYNRVIALGAPMKTCMSLAISNATLEAGWTQAEREAYDAADDKTRTTDAFKRVYAFFRIPRAWNWTYNSGMDGTPYIANPWHTSDGRIDVTVQGPFWNADHGVLRWIPFEQAAASADAEPEMRRPFAVVQNPDRAEGTDEYHYVNELQAALLENHHFGVSDREMGILIKGRANHTFALNHFGNTGENPTEPEATNVLPSVDYAEMICTVFLPTDVHAKVVYFIPENAGMESAKDLVIEMPEAEVWYIAGGTVSEISGGQLVYNNGGLPQVVRDDTHKLRKMAAAAAAWYGQQRNTFTLERAGIAPIHPTGRLIRAVATTAFHVENVGTVITQRRFDYRDNRMTIQTGYTELDFEVLQQ